MRPVLAFASLLAAPAFGLTPASALTPVERKDVVDGFGAVFCASEAAPSALPLSLWEKGITDAQIEGRALVRRLGREASVQMAERKARTLARMRRYLGYAHGTCTDGRAWAIGLPAPEPLVRQGDELLLPQAALREACESWRVDFARNAGGDAEQLHAAAGKVSLKGLDDGVVSLTCQPHAPGWRGPVEWHMSPVGKAPGTLPPKPEALTVGKSAEEGLIAWVNRIRTAAKLPPLAPRDELTREADMLAIDPSLTHNRKLLRKATEALASQKLRLIGEDRVKGRDTSEMAWLLWHSPRHRALLLDKKATGIGIALRKAGDGELAVLVVAAHDATLVGRSDNGARPDPVRRR
jgi:hypothetical protein